MYVLKIAALGDNARLHEEALAAAVAAVEQVNHATVYRAWVEKASDAEVQRSSVTP
jgi:hypothetical protein